MRGVCSSEDGEIEKFSDKVTCVKKMILVVEFSKRFRRFSKIRSF